MAETRTFSVQCPDPDCLAEFDVLIPIADLAEGAETGEPVTCTECQQEWDWSFDAESDTFELESDEEEEEDEEEDEDLADEFEGAE